MCPATSVTAAGIAAAGVTAAGATTCTVAAIVSGVPSNALIYTTTAVPTLTGLSASSGLVETAVTITTTTSTVAAAVVH